MQFDLRKTTYQLRADRTGSLFVSMPGANYPLLFMLLADKWTSFCFVDHTGWDFMVLFMNDQEQARIPTPKNSGVDDNKISTNNNTPTNNSTTTSNNKNSDSINDNNTISNKNIITVMTVANPEIAQIETTNTSMEHQIETTNRSMEHLISDQRKLDEKIMNSFSPFSVICMGQSGAGKVEWIQVHNLEIVYFVYDRWKSLYFRGTSENKHIFHQGNSSHHLKARYNRNHDWFSLIQYKAAVSYDGLKSYCQFFRGTLLSESDAKDFAPQMRAFNGSCINDDEIVSWIEQDSLQIELTSWCPVLLLNGSRDVRPCLKSLRCGFCRIPSPLKISVHGQIGKYDRNYVLMINPDGSYFLKGENSSFVDFVNDHWTLQSNMHEETCTANQTSSPFVRLKWICGKQIVNLTFSTCENFEFACSSGTCIDTWHRCNRKVECDDNSDEQDCWPIEKKKIGYNILQEPPGLPGEDDFNVEYTLRVYSIEDVETVNFHIDATIEIAFIWDDNRLSFKDIRTPQYFNCEDIWTPALQAFQSTEFSHFIQWPQNLTLACQTINCEPVSEQGRIDYFMSGAGGAKCKLKQVISGPVRIPCPFNLRKYPFGKQVCKLCLSSRKLLSRVKFSKRYTYSINAHNVGEYLFEQVTQEMGSGNSTLCIVFHLKSLYSYHLLNTYFISFLILMISYSTFMFRVTAFGERISVSLTTLLVMTGLFIQVNSSAIKTQYLKLLDIWYAAIIIFAFLVTICHALLNYIQRKMELDPGTSLTNRNNSPSKLRNLNHNRIACALLVMGLALFLLFYVLAAAEVV